jgi:IS5 family transposase
VIIERGSRQIIDVQEGRGSEHDFKVYKDTIGKAVSRSIPIDADSGYQGLQELHPNCRIPAKASKKHKLTAREKAYNRRLAKKRVVIEHVNAKIKTFKSMAYPYRNHCRRHLLRMSIICGIINYESR